MIVPAVGDPPPPTAILQAVRALAQGQPIGIPTDTVYGLAVDPFRPGAADRLFAAKRRPRDVNLPLLVTGVDQALAVSTAVPELALELMERYWPGPLTIVIPAKPGLGADLGEDELTVGVRSPAHPVPQALCAAAGPLATTSANRHGEPPLC
ncbi:MAG TPA: L-threonylcarbamoyladenylate synthase, partial [Acidimicrobiales bacterium]|nr:L-threonylcarbamoyladenylate synthase [Acidimicrobiales bacterium]